MSDGPFLGDVSILSCASHFLGLLAGFHRRLREIISVVVAHSVLAGEEGAARAEGIEPSPCRARTGKPGWGAGRGESHSIRGSRLSHPRFGNPSSPEGSRCHTQCHRPVLISSCRSALELTPCWHRRLRITSSVPPTASLAWNKLPPWICFAF